MSKFNFHHPIAVRYGDIDLLGHVNNVHFIGFMQEARLFYLAELGEFGSWPFDDLPLIVADNHCRYLLPIQAGGKVVVSLGVTSIGNKSMTFEYEITGEGGAPLYATAETIMVTYDYNAKKSVPVSAAIRQRISEVEGKDFGKGE